MTKLTYSIVFAILLITACKKKPTDVIKPAELRLEISSSFITNSEIDSVTIVGFSNETRFEKRLQNKNQSYVILLEELEAAPNEIEIRLFSNKLINFMPFVFNRKINKPTLAITINGPQNINDSDWLPRAFMRDAGTNIIAIMGLRPDDGFLGIYNLEAKWIDLTIEKTYYNKLSRVAGKLWECYGTNCLPGTGIYENPHFFDNIATQITGKEYNHLEQLFMYGDGNVNNGWRVVNFNFNF